MQRFVVIHSDGGEDPEDSFVSLDEDFEVWDTGEGKTVAVFANREDAEAEAARRNSGLA